MKNLSKIVVLFLFDLLTISNEEEMRRANEECYDKDLG